MKNKLVSIIIPYYKKKKFFKETISSINNQRYKDYEVIVIYDDEDISELDFVKKAVLPIKKKKIIINRKNLGVGLSRNKGIKISKGNFIAFCDADDKWSPNKLFEQINFMNKKKLNFSHTSYKIIDNESKVIGSFRIDKKMIKISKDRLSPVVTISVESFEPLFAAELSKRLIEKSGQIQNQLRTNRVRQKRLFIEERLKIVSGEMKKMEKELRDFREYNRNLSSSPSLEMRVQEMGREIDLQSSLYITLKTQYEKAKIDEVERNDMVQQIDGPNIPTKLTRPRRGLSIVLSLFFGIFMSIFSIYFRENYLEQNPYNPPL